MMRTFVTSAKKAPKTPAPATISATLYSKIICWLAWQVLKSSSRVWDTRAESLIKQKTETNISTVSRGRGSPVVVVVVLLIWLPGAPFCMFSSNKKRIPVGILGKFSNVFNIVLKSNLKSFPFKNWKNCAFIFKCIGI